MKEVFQAISDLLETTVSKNIKYVFKEKFETNETYEFILLIEKSDIALFGKTSEEGLVGKILKVANSKVSKFQKKILIDLEVFENYVW